MRRFLVYLVYLVLSSTSASSSTSPCPPGRLAVYRVDLATYWTEETFPKQYPLWRPNAQWSKTVGYSHSSASPLFSLGSVVKEPTRQFVETASSELLDRGLANTTYLDTVLLPPILQGEGAASTTLFVDSNHSKVSLVTKIVPSPDWFVGLDSLELCRGGAFLPSFSWEAFPMDAGTDNGFTFTSPNWETEPRAKVFRITSSFPSHPASSFHYPSLAALPRLAMYTLTRLREYQLTEELGAATLARQLQGNKYKYTLEAARGEEVVEFVPLTNAIPPLALPTVGSRARETVGGGAKETVGGGAKVALGGRAKVAVGRPVTKGFRSSSSVGGYHASTSPREFLKKRYSSNLLDQAQTRLYPSKGVEGSKAALYQHILASYGGLRSRHEKKKLRRKRKSRKARSCRVGAWGSWGSCSKTCGIGEAVRRRRVEVAPRHGGATCPKLEEFRWCGSARNCKTGYFRW